MTNSENVEVQGLEVSRLLEGVRTEVRGLESGRCGQSEMHTTKAATDLVTAQGQGLTMGAGRHSDKNPAFWRQR